MNLRSNSGGSNGSFFAWLAILGFAAYFMESRTHFFDAPSLKGYSLGMTLKDFKDSQIPNLALQYTEKPNNVLSVTDGSNPSLSGAPRCGQSGCGLTTDPMACFPTSETPGFGFQSKT
jgi:hypothetical protein